MVTLLSLSISQFAFAATSTTPIKNKSGSTVGTLTVTAGTVYKDGGNGGADIFDCSVNAETTVTCSKITKLRYKVRVLVISKHMLKICTAYKCQIPQSAG